MKDSNFYKNLLFFLPLEEVFNERKFKKSDPYINKEYLLVFKSIYFPVSITFTWLSQLLSFMMLSTDFALTFRGSLFFLFLAPI